MVLCSYLYVNFMILETVETSTDSLKSDETIQLEKKTETQAEDMDRETVDVENKTLGK